MGKNRKRNHKQSQKFIDPQYCLDRVQRAILEIKKIQTFTPKEVQEFIIIFQSILKNKTFHLAQVVDLYFSFVFEIEEFEKTLSVNASEEPEKIIDGIERNGIESDAILDIGSKLINSLLESLAVEDNHKQLEFHKTLLKKIVKYMLSVGAQDAERHLFLAEILTEDAGSKSYAEIIVYCRIARGRNIYLGEIEKETKQMLCHDTEGKCLLKENKKIRISHFFRIKLILVETYSQVNFYKAFSTFMKIDKIIHNFQNLAPSILEKFAKIGQMLRDKQYSLLQELQNSINQMIPNHMNAVLETINSQNRGEIIPLHPPLLGNSRENILLNQNKLNVMLGLKQFGAQILLGFMHKSWRLVLQGRTFNAGNHLPNIKVEQPCVFVSKLPDDQPQNSDVTLMCFSEQTSYCDLHVSEELLDPVVDQQTVVIPEFPFEQQIQDKYVDFLSVDPPDHPNFPPLSDLQIQSDPIEVKNSGELLEERLQQTRCFLERIAYLEAVLRTVKIKNPTVQLPPGIARMLSVIIQGRYGVLIVGGAVRALLKREPIVEVDLITGMPPEVILRSFENVKKSSHISGLYKINVFGFQFDILSCDPNIFTSEQSLLEDARKRAFTVNALYCDINGRIYDPLKVALHDLLQTPILRLIDNNSVLFSMDPSLLLRVGRLVPRCNLFVPQETVTLIQQCSENVKQLPFGQLHSELSKLFLRGQAVINFECLKHFKIFQSIYPETDSILSSEEKHYQTWLYRKLQETDQLVTHRQGSMIHVYAYFLLGSVLHRAKKEKSASAVIGEIIKKVVAEYLSGAVQTLSDRVEKMIETQWCTHIKELFGHNSGRTMRAGRFLPQYQRDRTRSDQWPNVQSQEWSPGRNRAPREGYVQGWPGATLGVLR